MIKMIDVEDELNHILQEIKIDPPQVVEDDPAPKVNNENVPINAIDTQDEPVEVEPLVDEVQNTRIQPVVIEDLELDLSAVDTIQAMDQELYTIDPQPVQDEDVPVRPYSNRPTLSTSSKPRPKPLFGFNGT